MPENQGSSNNNRPPHPATLPRGGAVQPKTNGRAPGPHPATLPRGAVQPKTNARASSPHPATLPRSAAVQPKVERSPHPATLPRSSAAQPRLNDATRAPHPATLRGAATGAVQRMEQIEVIWTCKSCNTEQTTASAYKKPDKKGCTRNRKGHDWALGAAKERQQKTTEKYTSMRGSEETSDEGPSRFKEARTWDALAGLVANWAGFSTAELDNDDVAVFSNVGSRQGAIEAIEILEKKSTDWRHARPTAVDDPGASSGKALTHTGVLKATALDDETVRLTFYGAAANVYIDSKTREVGWLRDGENPTNNGGSCHTEQMCLYRLHQSLLRLRKEETAFSLVTLQWYTEKPMCEQWCVPALSLFTSYWSKQGVAVVSGDFS